MDFVSFKLAKKLKEKGFEMPTNMVFAMYNQLGTFHTLTTSANYSVSDSGFKCRCYYDFDDFDEYDFVAPTISQVLKWLREDKGVNVIITLWNGGWYVDIQSFTEEDEDGVCFEIHDLFQSPDYESYEEAALAGIEYVLDNLI